MLAITCPWCQEGAAVELADITESLADLVCPDCGTSVALVEEPLALEPAA